MGSNSIQEPAIMRDTLMPELVKTVLAESKGDKESTKNMVTKLSELMFLRALRQIMDTLDEQNVENWLTAVKDKHVGYESESAFQQQFKR